MMSVDPRFEDSVRVALALLAGLGAREGTDRRRSLGRHSGFPGRVARVEAGASLIDRAHSRQLPGMRTAPASKLEESGA
jgi:hypothetical protein